MLTPEQILLHLEEEAIYFVDHYQHRYMGRDKALYAIDMFDLFLYYADIEHVPYFDEMINFIPILYNRVRRTDMSIRGIKAGARYGTKY